jgi:hypothetical protein
MQHIEVTEQSDHHHDDGQDDWNGDWWCEKFHVTPASFEIAWGKLVALRPSNAHMAS